MSDASFFVFFAIFLSVIAGFMGFLIGSNYGYDEALDRCVYECPVEKQQFLNLSECIDVVGRASYDTMKLQKDIDLWRNLK